MAEEWRISREILSDLTGSPVVAASIPGGDMNLESQKTAAEAGFKFLFTSEPTLSPWRVRGMTCLGRVCLRKGCSLNLVRELAQFRGYQRQMLIRKSKNLAKRVLYPYYRWTTERHRA